MPDYKYQGTSRSGGSVSGVMTASNKTELASLLKRQQITATKMTEKGKEFNIPTFGAGIKAKELAIFTRQFSVMIDAGLPLVQCLEILAGQQENKFFQKVLAGTRGQVEGGATLPVVVESCPNFCHLVCRPGRGFTAAHKNRHCHEQFHRQHFWFSRPCGHGGFRLRFEGLVWHSPGPFGA